MAELTRQERLNRLRNAQTIVAEESKALGLSSEDLGENGDQKVEDRNPLALRFDKMTPLERYNLYTTDREEWRRLANAKAEEGVRRLFASRPEQEHGNGK